MCQNVETINICTAIQISGKRKNLATYMKK